MKTIKTMVIAGEDSSLVAERRWRRQKCSGGRGKRAAAVMAVAAWW
jgi:hypothetical protein